MEQILKAIQQMEGRINEKFEKVDQNFENVTEQLDRMETTLHAVAETANHDTMAIFERIDRNTKTLNQDIEFLSEQAGRHEMYFNRINKN
jgi:predicted  nucleic acid-binding Zn-ribbon protein